MYDDDEKVLAHDEDEDELTDNFDGDSFPGLDDDVEDEDEPLNIGMKDDDDDSESMEEDE